MIPHLLEQAPAELERLAEAPEVVVALDFDGTISPIAPTPEAARLLPAAGAAIDRLLGARGVRVVIASGRPVAELRRLVPSVRWFVGLHGLEVQAEDREPRLRFDPRAADEAMARLRIAIVPLVLAGARLEDKIHALAVHVRGLDPEAAADIVERATAAIEAEIALGAPIECLQGKAVVEARPLGATKHGALAELLDHLGTRNLLFAGDDRTDEGVFEAFRDALTVLVAAEPRQTAARTFVRSPLEVAAMLERFVDLRAGRR